MWPFYLDIARRLLHVRSLDPAIRVRSHLLKRLMDQTCFLVGAVLVGAAPLGAVLVGAVLVGGVLVGAVVVGGVLVEVVLG